MPGTLYGVSMGGCSVGERCLLVGGVLPYGGGAVCWLLYGFSRGMDAMIALGVWLRGRRIT